MNGDNKLIHYRAIPTEIHMRAEPLPSGGRQLSGRLVPYNTVATVLDVLPDGQQDIYREGFRPGAFDGQVRNGGVNRTILAKIGLIHKHDGGLGYLGPFVALRDAADGLWGDVNILPSKGDDVASLITNGVQELSIEFRLPRGDNTAVDDDGVRWRTKAHLDQVALEAKGAYSTAQVLAYRQEVDDAEREQAELEAEMTKKAELEAEAQAELEANLAESTARRAAWDEMTARLDTLRARQDELVRKYGVTKPGGYGRLQDA
jgi:HK97 family phage prohead protease